MNAIPEFEEFPKIARLRREIVITEKIDGTNASILITEDGQFLVGSRTRWITHENDNHGFATWAYSNEEELRQLGPGHHFGEWWGSGIQRNYGMTYKVFSLFNTTRWKNNPARPACCSVVPELYRGPFDEAAMVALIGALQVCGSQAAPGFMKPEGIVVYHTAANLCFKQTIEKDEVPKGLRL